MAVRSIRMFEDPDLQSVCRPVSDVNDHIRATLDDLVDTMQAYPGCVAVAANQIGVKRRLIVVSTPDGVKKLVNPVITEQSGQQECFEGCISFKDIYGIMLRPEKITVEALDENGDAVTVTAEGTDVSMYCHPIDLLDGKIFIKEVVRFVNIDGE